MQHARSTNVNTGWVREALARVEHEPGGSDRGNPDVSGILHALTHRALVDTRPLSVVHPEPDDGPTVVHPFPDEVHLVTAPRPVLVLPDRSGLRVHGEPLGVALAVAPDLRHRAGPSHERVVRRHRW